MPFDARLMDMINAQPYPLLFATISGAHLYGFPSPDSDYDLRGVHILPKTAVLGLDEEQETLESTQILDGLEIDLVTHDAKKFFLLLLKRNGYVLEQLYSTLILHSTPEYEELKNIAHGCITRHHSQHYKGFATNQWQLFSKESPGRIKPLLYVYRVLLTGIHLMRSGEIEANLLRLNDEYRLPYIAELVARKLAGAEQSTLDKADLSFYEHEYERLQSELESAYASSTLPDEPTARATLNDLLIRLRLASG